MQEPFPYFPHETVRAGQDALLKDIDAALASQKILLAHAPTGLGKTAAALSVALQHAIEKQKKVLFLTNRHTQHLIAIETIKLIERKTGEKMPCADLIGKRWMCSQDVAGLYGNEFNEFCKAVVEKGECEFYNNVRSEKGLQVAAKKLLGDLKENGALHNQELVAISKGQRMCSYEIALAMAKKARVIVGDYYYLFNPHVRGAVMDKLGISLEETILIVDEGHNLPGRITDMQSTMLTTLMLRNAILEARKYQFGTLIRWLQEMNKVLQNLALFGKEKERKVSREDFSRPLEQAEQEATAIPVKYAEIANQFQLAAEEVRKKQRKSYLGGVASFLESWNGADESFVRILSERQGAHESIFCLNYACLDPSVLSRDIFSQAYAGVLMSGTLKPQFMYADLLGIERAVEKEYDSPFPPENRLSLVVPVSSTKYTLRGEVMYKTIAQHCSAISSLVPGNVALFFPSYSMRDAVGRFVGSPKKLFWERADWGKEEKEAFLNDFKAEGNGSAGEGGLLLGVAGANFAEGIDLPGNLLNGVVVVGLPLAKPDLKTKELISYYDQKFGRGWEYGYVYPAMNKCLQSAGRCIRSETDKGAIVFLDERFAWQQYFCCLPREGLRVSKEYRVLLKEFFK